MPLELNGIFSIPTSCFERDGSLDLSTLRRQVEFSIRAGAHAIIGPVIASEVWHLSLAERQRWVEVAAEQCARRVPLIAGVSAQTAEESVGLARAAVAAGADGLIAMLPMADMTGEWEPTRRFYGRLAEKAGVEIVVQNGGRDAADRIPIENLQRLLAEIPLINYIKDEGVPSNHRVTELRRACGTRLRGVFGGMGGRYMIDELRRGACGFAPICTFTDVLVQIYQHWRAGRHALAVEIHEKLALMLNIELQVGQRFAKELMRRRGIASETFSRMHQVDLDAFDVFELEMRWARLAPYLKNVF